MIKRITCVIFFMYSTAHLSMAGGKAVVSLKDFSQVELKTAGFDLSETTAFTVKALGGGGDYGWSYKSDQLFAYGWIIDADTREVVWKMDVDNTSHSGDDREFDGTVTLQPGSYEVYFTAYSFAYHTTFTHINVNIDHRDKPLFGEYSKGDKDILKFFKDWWSDDIAKDWEKRCRNWGIELTVDGSKTGLIKTFTPPKQRSDVLLKAVGLGERELVRRGFSVATPMQVKIYALGEIGNDGSFADYGWIVNADNRSRIWEMQKSNVSSAGGAKKNIKFSDEVDLPKGEYVLYYISDDSHSAEDWNAAPPDDPLNWGVTLISSDEKSRKNFKTTQYTELQNVIVSLTKMRNNENRSAGFTLRSESKLRIYAFGERGNSRRLMADYGTVTDARTRNKVWTMDVDRTYHGGGDAQNRYVDEIITLSKGSYIVTYTTDDSHGYDDWNKAPPFDPENYGITVMGAGENFNADVVGKYVEQRERNLIAQIVKVGDDANREERFKLDRTTRIRVYALGEGQNREMYDYGWIEDVKTGNVVWEMTYSMTFHAGGGRKNRMVNTTILLDKGEYKLHYMSDGSHSYGDWNVDPPEDQQYWGITLYKDDGLELPSAPVAPDIPH